MKSAFTKFLSYPEIAGPAKRDSGASEQSRPRASIVLTEPNQMLPLSRLPPSRVKFQMDWDADAFLKHLKAGEFDGRLNEVLQRLSPEQLQTVEHLLEREKRQPSAPEQDEPETKT